MRTAELEGGGWKMLANLLGTQANPAGGQLITDQQDGGVSTPPHPPAPGGAEIGSDPLARPLARNVSGFGADGTYAEKIDGPLGAGGGA